MAFLKKSNKNDFIIILSLLISALHFYLYLSLSECVCVPVQRYATVCGGGESEESFSKSIVFPSISLQ